MAKGDHKRMENEINAQRSGMMGGQERLENSLYGTQGAMMNNYNQGAGMNLGSYNQIMQGYQNMYDKPFGEGGMPGVGYSDPFGSEYGMYSGLAQQGGGYGWDPEWRGAVSGAIGGYGDFAKTGGFSEADLQNIRARSIAPTRAIYSNAMDQAARGRSLQQFSPNYNAALSRMARESGYAIGDINTNANAGIAQMVQQGKLAGLAGLSGTGLGAQGRSTDIDSLNAQMKLAGLAGMTGIDQSRLGADLSASAANAGNVQDEARMRMAALGGMTDLYGTNPALANVFGSQALGAGQNLLGGQELRNQMGLGLIGSRYNNAQLPGNFQSAMGNIGSAMGVGGRFVGGLIGLGGLTGLGDYGKKILGIGGGKSNPLGGYNPGGYSS
ncbi:MAG TPA: hypothetical protein VIH27_01315 [Nitrososphaerales archaeon]